MSIEGSNEEIVSVGSTALQIPDTAAFGVSLKRNNSQIRKDRADELTRKTFMKFKRKIEDLDDDLYTMLTRRENMLDLSPANAQSLVPAVNFDADAYLEEDIALSKNIREKSIIANMTRRRCNYLFGTTYALLPVEE